MKLPDPADLNAYVETLFGEDYTKTLRSLAMPQPVDDDVNTQLEGEAK